MLHKKVTQKGYLNIKSSRQIHGFIKICCANLKTIDTDYQIDMYYKYGDKEIDRQIYWQIYRQIGKCIGRYTDRYIDIIYRQIYKYNIQIDK